MTDWLLSTEGFVPRRNCGAWTQELIGLHAGSDILIWLAYLSIPLILAYFARQRGVRNFRSVFWLFAAFILCCGFTHLIDAVNFDRPMYRLGGVMKAVTAIVSWATVFALIPLVPRLLSAVQRVEDTSQAMPSLAALQAEPARAEPTTRRYIVAILGAIIAVLVRGLFNPILQGDHVFVIPLLAVVFVAWNNGFGPGLVTLFLSMAAITFIFIVPEYALVKSRLSDYIAIGMFLFAGVGCALLGEAQRQHRTRANRNLAVAQERQRELEALTAQLRAAQRETVETLAQLDTFVMNAPLGLAFFDPELRFVRINKELADAHGKEIADHIGRPLADVLPDQPLSTVAGYRRVLETGEPVTDQIVVGSDDVPRAAGRVWHSSYYPVRRPDGALLGVGQVTREITQQVQAERAVRESEARFRTLAEAMPQIVWVTRPDGGREYFNQRWYEYTGRTVADSLGEEWVDAIHPDDREAAAARWEHSKATGEPYENERRFRDHAGRYRWFLARALPQRDDAGKILRWFGTCTDIEDAKRVQAAITQSLDRFRALAEAVPCVVFTATPEGTVDYFNQRWFDYTGSHDIEADLLWEHIIHPDDLTHVKERWFGAVSASRSYENEFRMLRHDGTYRWHLARGLAVVNSEGAVTQWVGTIVDIEDQRRYTKTLEHLVRDRTAELSEVVTALRSEVEVRRRAEQAAEAATLELRRSNGELEQFAYIASHDLQEPLRKIQAFAGRVQTTFRTQLGDTGTDYLTRVLSSAGRMRQLIDDLLMYSRVTSKAQPFVPVDLAEIAEGVLSDLEVRILQTNGSVSVGQMPTIDADAMQMRQLFQNLIGNALKFHRSNVPPVISVTATITSEENPVCRLDFTDNGIGFDVKYLDRIFHVFQRLHGRGEYEGTGVGLAICRKIAERHGGSITATSQLGQGSTFRVVLPVQHQLSRSADSDA